MRDIIQMGYDAYETVREHAEGFEDSDAYKDIWEARYKEKFAESLFEELSKEKGEDIAPHLSCEYDLVRREYRITLSLPYSFCSKTNYYA